MARHGGPLEGLPLVGVAALAAVGMLFGAAFAAGWSEEGVRIIVRATAKVGVVLFALAFTASSLRGFVRHDATAWLLRNRRYLGLSFAVYHFLHLAALVALGVAFPEPFVGELDIVTLVGGGLAYALLTGMVATSNDAAVRALGRRRWTLLHTLGSWYIWIIFTQSFVPRAFVAPVEYAPFAALLFGVLGVRLARALRTRGARAGAPA